MDYLSPLSNACCFIMGVEQLLGITVTFPCAPASARNAVRTAPDCLALRVARYRRIDLGAISGFFYAFDLRERILDLTELSAARGCIRTTCASAACATTCRRVFSAKSTS